MPVNNYSLHIEIPQKKNINYQLFLPHQYEMQNDKKYPLIVFLHGNVGLNQFYQSAGFLFRKRMDSQTWNANLYEKELQ